MRSRSGSALHVRKRLLIAALATVAAVLVTRAPAVHAAPASPASSAAAAAVMAAENAGRDDVERAAPDSPRVSLSEYLDLCRAGRYADAARFLEMPKGARPADGARLAQRLEAVLRRHLLIDLDDVSADSLGDPNDALPAGIDEIGRIAAHAGGGSGVKGDPVRLVRRADADGSSRWQFAFSTVERIDKWYAALEDRWLRERLPEMWFRRGPRDLMWWQWLALPALVAMAALVGFAITRAMRPLLDRFLPKPDGAGAVSYRERLRAPVRLGWAIGALALAVPWLALDRSAEAFVLNVLRTTFHLTIFWTLVRLVDAASTNAGTSQWGKAHPAGAGLMPLVGKLAKIALAAIATVAILSELGYPVASIVAGLGIGGLALALAAQKTVENLFGGVSIGADQPFRIGDLVSVDGITGTVEALGLRSTRIRTLDRTLVTIPNGKLAEMRIENFSARDRFRFNALVPLAPNTPHDVLATIIKTADAHIRGMDAVWPDAVDVMVKEFAKDSLVLEVTAAFVVKDAIAFRPVRLALNLRLAEIVALAGARFADPSDGAPASGVSQVVSPTP